MNRVLLALTLCTGLLAPAHARDVAPLEGLLAGSSQWAVYKQRFVRGDGRVVDNANGNVSHSEGQGFAMIMALAARDRAAFDAIWGFARDRLGVRRDGLFAWRWKPRPIAQVADHNNATDGDILIAWALMEAEAAGWGQRYGKAAQRIRKGLSAMLKHHPTYGTYLRPAAYGFSPDHQDGVQVLNLSYFVFPALERMAELSGETVWLSAASAGARLVEEASRNRAGLPADWTALSPRTGKVGVAAKFDDDFSYNAVRVPLYMAWARDGHRTALVRMAERWGRQAKLSRIDVTRGRATGRFAEQGYRAVASLMECALDGTRYPDRMRTQLDTLYYPASLNMLATIAVRQRYPQCW